MEDKKTTETVDMHINTIIDIAFLKGQQASQPKITELQKQLIDQGQRFNEQAQRVKDLEHKNNELQKRADVQTKHIEMALVAVKDINESALDEFNEWDVLKEKLPKICEHLQNLSFAVGELEQALKGGSNHE